MTWPVNVVEKSLKRAENGCVGNNCHGPEESSQCLGLGWWVWKWRKLNKYEKFGEVKLPGLREWLDLRNRESYQGCQVYDPSSLVDGGIIC